MSFGELAVVQDNQTVFTYVDLFAGCGGLSLGLGRAGGKHLLAVEKSPMASETYFRNLINASPGKEAWSKHLSLSLQEQVDAGLYVGPVSDVLHDQAAMSNLASMEIDLVAGGPPCQGFSLAGRRRSSDSRNGLPWQFLEFVGEVAPKIVLIENVVGMDHALKGKPHGRSPFAGLKVALAATGPGYVVQGVLLNAMHFGAPQTRPRLMILGVRSDIAASLGLEPSDELRSSTFKNARAAESAPTVFPKAIIRSDQVLDVKAALALIGQRLPPTKMAAFRYASEMKNGRAWKLRRSADDVPPLNHVERNHRPRTRDSFRLLQILTSCGLLIDARRIRAKGWSPSSRRELRERLVSVNFPVTSPDGELRVLDIEQLAQLVESHLTLKHSQTVLKSDKPARTVVTIPDDYIHPSEPRTFTVRELARFQGFPDSFEFFGKVTTGGTSRRNEVPQYSQVGNAVSPWVALAIGKMVGSLTSQSREEYSGSVPESALKVRPVGSSKKKS